SLRPGPMSGRNRLILAFAGSLAYFPYVVLIGRHSYASAGDINMIPFQLFIGCAGLFFVCAATPLRRPLGMVLLLIAMTLNFGSLADHFRKNPYHGLDPNKTVYQISDTLVRYQYDDILIYGLYQDIYFNAATYLHVLHRDPYLRTRIRGRLPTLSSQDLPTPETPAPLRYERVAAPANVLLISSRPRGPQYMAINRQHAEMADLIAGDSRYLRLATIPAYDDGNAIHVYAKRRAIVETESDGWLANGGTITLLSPIGHHRITIEGQAHDGTIRDLFLRPEEGADIPGKRVSAENTRFSFDVHTTELLSRFEVRSRSPLMPTGTDEDADHRELLLLSPHAHSADHEP
ncbi:hypothetical protein JYT83_01270, partial [bacterium AH-315-F18]|nr:hypothetical protein [bacterium AH-315-F18]